MARPQRRPWRPAWSRAAQADCDDPANDRRRRNGRCPLRLNARHLLPLCTGVEDFAELHASYLKTQSFGVLIQLKQSHFTRLHIDIVEISLQSEGRGMVMNASSSKAASTGQASALRSE